MRKLGLGKSVYHVDVDFEGERLVDDVSLLEDADKRRRKVLVHSPKLRADILVFKRDLK